MRRPVLIAAIALFFAAAAHAATYYVRTDGGSPQQCSGTTDAPYPGSGSAQPCAWEHPFRALPPGGLPRIAAGDTLVIGSGSYMMGYGAPGADACDATGAWGCTMPPIPSGPSPASPTRVVGTGWNSGCSAPPQLWGSERAEQIIDLTRSSNVEVRCFEITDHSGCVESHSGGIACNRDTPPYGTWAALGIRAADSTNVLLRDLNIHGLAGGGIQAGRLTDWTLQNVRIAANGWSGFDGDIEGDDSDSGTIRFSSVTIEWNGCGETWPAGAPTGCWAQSAGGYGDGLGTGATKGRWIFEDCKFLNNTSDGLDLLYARPGSSIEIRRTLARGNAGNQIKTAGPAIVENSIIVGDCAFHQGKPFTHDVDPCRALGAALSIDLFKGDQATVANCTFTSEGDCLVAAECAESSPCDGSERLTLRNNIFVGQTDYLQPFESTCLMYQETFPKDPFDSDYSIVVNVKESACPGAHDRCNTDPRIADNRLASFDAHLTAASPAINAGTTSAAPSTDYDNQSRDVQPDIGAYEYRVGATVPVRRRAVKP